MSENEVAVCEQEYAVKEISKPDKNYSPKEEIINAFTHAFGALFAIYAIVMLVYKSTTPIQCATTAIYAAMLFVLFEASTCYHAMTNETAKKVFRKIDHSAIYLLIAGTYTPLLLLVLPFPYSVIFLVMIWYLAATGIVFSCLTLKFKGLSTGLYITMGWLSVFLFYALWVNGFKESLWFLLGGGVVYTIGSYFYMKDKKYYHCIWHLFVLIGAIMHYFSVYSLLK